MTSVLLLALLCGAAVDVTGTPAPAVALTPAPTTASTFEGTDVGPTIAPDTPAPTFQGTDVGPTIAPDTPAPTFQGTDVGPTIAPDTPAPTFQGTDVGPTIAPDTPAPTFTGTIGGPTFQPFTTLTPITLSACFDPDSSEAVDIETVEAGIRVFFGCELSDDDLVEVAAVFDEVGRSNIISVTLSRGTITALPGDFFLGFDNLTALYLDSQRFTTLPPGLFDGLSELGWLELGYNEEFGGTIEAGTFDALTKLGYLDLTDMGLVSLPLGLFDQLPDLRFLQINLNYDLQCIPETDAVVYFYWSTSTYDCDCTEAEDDACGDGFRCNPAAAVHQCTAGGYRTPTPVTTVAPTPAEPLSLGCFKDEGDDRIMETRALVDSMTTELCELTCAGYSYFSTQYGRECWCGEADTDYAKHGESTACDYECLGNPNQTCGGFYAANVYAYVSGNTPAPTVITPTSPEYVGCFEDQQSDRIMSNVLADEASMTPTLCETECEGATYFGLQWGRQCWCGNQDTDLMKHGESTACDDQCLGDPDEICGGYNAMDVYAYPGVTTPASAYVGCFEDQQSDRIMSSVPADEESMTPELCKTECEGSTYFGLQWGRQCWCGGQDTDLMKHGESTACDFECLGDPDETCGGYNAMDVYEFTS